LCEELDDLEGRVVRPVIVVESSNEASGKYLGKPKMARGARRALQNLSRYVG